LKDWTKKIGSELRKEADFKIGNQKAVIEYARKNDLNLEMGFGGTWNNFRKPKSEVEVNKTSDNKPLYKNFRDFFLHLLTNIMCFVSCSIPILFILFCIWIVAVIDSTYSLF